VNIIAPFHPKKKKNIIAPHYQNIYIYCCTQ